MSALFSPFRRTYAYLVRSPERALCPAPCPGCTTTRADGRILLHSLTPCALYDGLTGLLQQRTAHEQPAVYYSIWLGFLGTFASTFLLPRLITRQDCATPPPSARPNDGYNASMGETDALPTPLKGPAMVVTVPEIRKRFFGWKPVERPPTTYPRAYSSSVRWC